ncbi:MAG: transposase [Gammaproteobacteria bacterium]|nr:MAG: transposase [Gammaproteobacteria bacterium]
MLGDKAYQRPDAAEVEQSQQLTVLTSVKKKKGRQHLEADEQWLSTAVSQVRQPIEALFAWIEKKVGIEVASNVRSYQGLLVHVFGHLAAALFFWNQLKKCP